MSNEIHNVLEAMKALQDNQISSCKEMLKEKLISEETAKDILNTAITQYNQTLLKMQELREPTFKELETISMQHNRELEEERMKYEHDLKEKQIEANKSVLIEQNKPKTFMEHLDNISCNIIKGFESSDHK